MRVIIENHFLQLLLLFIIILPAAKLAGLLVVLPVTKFLGLSKEEL